MKLKYKFAIEKVGDKFLAVTVDEDAGKFNGALKVNEYGMMIVKALQVETTKEVIVSKLKEEFDDIEDLSKQVDDFISQLEKEDLLV